MKLISYNVNGIRSAIRKGLPHWLKATDADFLCIQEMKAEATEVPVDLFKEMGYHAFLKPAEQKGYSGVAIFSRYRPQKVQYEIGEEAFDREGRYIELIFHDFHLINVYVPTGAASPARQTYKMQFLEALYHKIKAINHVHVILCGDLNICHSPLDLHNPKAGRYLSGFLEEECAWLDRMLDLGYLDAFRVFNQEPHHYTWWNYMGDSRKKNTGWRIDYFLISKMIKNRLIRSVILKEARHADHCPILLEVDEN